MTRHPPDPATPAPGQEPARTCPPTPRVERCHRHVLIVFAGQVVADTRRALRVLETTDPLVYYVPPGDYLRACFRPAADERFCEWKGVARSFDVVVGQRVAVHAAWSYPNPVPRYAVLQDCMAVYLGQMDACYVDGERVRVPHGRFRGGWVTRDVAIAFTGCPEPRGR